MKRTEKLSRKARYGILAAIMAGAFSIMPAAQAMPTGGASGTATITTTGSTMDIASSVTNNLITWQDFSIARGETVNFSGANTYLNVVTGGNASQIFGALNGSSANVFLVNPNGILIGDGAMVNVGSLHLSTADIKGSLVDFDTAKAALDGVATFSGDIVNKGTLKAAQEITVDGNNITFKNTADVTSPQVKLTSAGSGEIHIGSADGATPNYTMNGTKYMYKLVRTAEDLQNINNNLSGNYMLAGDITLTAPNNTETGSNFTPIGGLHWNVDAEKFTGRFDGLNYTIDNLYIYQNTTENYVSAGLFAAIGRSGVVENLTLGTGKSTLITDNNGYNGSFAGLNDGILRNVVNNGVAVTGSNYSSGGIVGYNCRLIDGATNKAAVTTRVSYSLGGIVGQNDGRSSADRTGIVRNSRNTGEVGNTASSQVGGIVGNNLQGTLENVGNSGTVKGDKYVGGIAGLSSNEISNAANTGNVQGTNWIGGVIGHNAKGTLLNAYNTGSITNGSITNGNNFGTGGVVGANEGIVKNVYNTGNVKGVNMIGGIAGLNGSDTTGYGVIENAYNTGKVERYSSNSGFNIGGIVGELVKGEAWYGPTDTNHTTGSIKNAYNTGEIIGSNGEKGGIFGKVSRNGTVTGAYDASDLPAKGLIVNQASADNVSGAVDKNLNDFVSASTFSGFSIDKDGTDASAVWRIYEGKTMPLLTAFLTPLTLADTTVTYDGRAHSIASLEHVDSTKILGGALASYTNAGTYAYSGLKGLYSDQQGYNIKAASDNATLTIDKAVLNFAVNGYTKTYDGTTTATGGTYSVSKGLIAGGAGALQPVVTYSDKNAGTNKAMSVTGLGNNYRAGTITGSGNTITAAPLTLTVADITKDYDGTTEAPNASYSITNGQLFGEDTLTGGVFAYEDKYVGTGKNVILMGVGVNDGNEGQNYTLIIVNSTNSAITANAPTAVVRVMEDKLEEAGTTMPKMEEVIAVATAPPVQFEEEQQSDSVETAATTATTQGDDHTNASVAEKGTMHNALGSDGTLTLVNEGVNPPESMSAEKVAQQNKNTNGENKEGE